MWKLLKWIAILWHVIAVVALIAGLWELTVLMFVLAMPVYALVGGMMVICSLDR